MIRHNLVEKRLFQKISLPSEITLAMSKSGEDSATPSTLSHVNESADIGDCGTCSFDETERYAQELLGEWGEFSITKELLKIKEMCSRNWKTIFVWRHDYECALSYIPETIVEGFYHLSVNMDPNLCSSQFTQ